MPSLVFSETFDTGYTPGDIDGQNGWAMTYPIFALPNPASMKVGDGVMYAEPSSSSIEHGIDCALPTTFDLTGDWTFSVRLKYVPGGSLQPPGLLFGLGGTFGQDFWEIRSNAVGFGDVTFFHNYGFFGEIDSVTPIELSQIHDEWFTVEYRIHGDRYTAKRNGEVFEDGTFDRDFSGVTKRLWFYTEPETSGGNPRWEIDTITLTQGTSVLELTSAGVRAALSPLRTTNQPL